MPFIGVECDEKLANKIVSEPGSGSGPRCPANFNCLFRRMRTVALISPSPVAEPVAPVFSPINIEALSLNDWIERIRQACSGNASQTLALARLIHRARRSLPYGSWSRLWQSGQVPFSKRKGEKLVVVGKVLGGLDANNCSHLPTAWSTLYCLARLGRTALERLILEGRIHAGLTLREAKALLAEFHPERTVKTPLSNIAVQLRRFGVWVRAEQKHWSLAERALVRQRLSSLAQEIWVQADIATLRPINPLAEKSSSDSGRSYSISML